MRNNLYSKQNIIYNKQNIIYSNESSTRNKNTAFNL